MVCHREARGGRAYDGAEGPGRGARDRKMGLLEGDTGDGADNVRVWKILRGPPPPGCQVCAVGNGHGCWSHMAEKTWSVAVDSGGYAQVRLWEAVDCGEVQRICGCNAELFGVTGVPAMS